MADQTSAPTWVQLLVSSGVLGLVGAATTRLWKWFVERPLQRAERRAELAEQREREARSKCDLLSGELKATGHALRSVRRLDEAESGAPLSMPPPREELPTLEHIIETRADRAWAEQRERERQQPLNPGRQDSIDYELGRYVQDVASTPPRAYPAPLEGVAPKPPRPRKGR